MNNHFLDCPKREFLRTSNNFQSFLFDKNNETVILYLSLIIPDHTFRNFLISPGSSVVEHLPEEQSVGGSIPSLGTNINKYFMYVDKFYCST